MSETRADAEVVATRTLTGGIVGFNSVLAVHADGTLRLSDRRFNRDESRKVPPAEIGPLRQALARPEWQEIEPSYGQPIPDGFEITIAGGGKRTGLASPSAGPVTIPPILTEVLEHLHGLWPATDLSPLDEAMAEARGFPGPNLFRLEGEDVQVSYGVLRARREFLDYKDRRRDLTFSGEGGEIDSQESRIGRLLTVELNREEAVADADLITLTVLLPRINLGGDDNPFETLAIRTTHLTGFRPGFAEGPQQSYEVLALRGTAHQAD